MLDQLMVFFLINMWPLSFIFLHFPLHISHICLLYFRAWREIHFQFFLWCAKVFRLVTLNNCIRGSWLAITTQYVQQDAEKWVRNCKILVLFVRDPSLRFAWWSHTCEHHRHRSILLTSNNLFYELGVSLLLLQACTFSVLGKISGGSTSE